ncbi:hypothetical protein RYX36_004628 [Vicia faba]
MPQPILLRSQSDLQSPRSNTSSSATDNKELEYSPESEHLDEDAENQIIAPNGYPQNDDAKAQGDMASTEDKTSEDKAANDKGGEDKACKTMLTKMLC